jgi:integrative and conjugative element protein (TIGR02256 family)
MGLAVGELSAQLRERQSLTTFCLYRTPGRGIRVSADHLYTQAKLGLSLLVTGECLDQLAELTQYHQPKEFGGVLVGSYCADGRCAVVSQLIIPAKYRQSSTSFAPDPTSINEQLRALSAPLHYLGDWHSHPNGPAQPSATDRATLARLAAHPQVQTHTPLLLIVQTRQQQVVPHFYVFQHGQLHAYESANL